MTDVLPPELAMFVGAEVHPFGIMRDPVEMSAIRRWCDAVGEMNPLYLDPDYAKTTEFGERVAPPAMLDAWVMPGYDADRSVAGDYMPVLAALTCFGYPVAVATDIEQHYVRYLALGDRLHTRSIVESISPEKQTGLGRGRFVSIFSEFRDQHDLLVGSMRMGLFKFAPAQSEGQEPA